ncbi:MAG: GAF domain-containing sensor histidine kinase [Candidatus Omnitrophica bacterium]|nr:GAF domain-containing sensor histidine kinase [Candidatus Omnitrophota bacterium]
MTRIRDLDKLLNTIVSTVVDTVKIPYAAVYLKDELHNSYHLKCCHRGGEGLGLKEFVSVDSGLVGELGRQKRPLLQEEIGAVEDLSLNFGLLIPCFMEDNLLGFLVLGPKHRGQMYTTDDMLVFETLSYSMSLAIENCIFWREIEDRQRKARLQEMDTYSYSLAHEIDNPMQVIRGHVAFMEDSLMEEGRLPKEEREEMGRSLYLMKEAAERVSKMVKAIREFGQVSTGKLAPLKIEDVITSFQYLMAPQLKVENIRLTQDITDDLPYVRGEKAELMQVLVIFANNAMHAMKYAKEKTINIRAELADRDTIKISFLDTGYGIKKHILPIIFSSFTTTKASTEGTGMGLYNAKKIIDRHKGRIWAESEGENKGAALFIELPVAKDITDEELKQTGLREEKSKGKRLF